MSEQLGEVSESEMPERDLEQAVAAIQAERVPAGPSSELVGNMLLVLRESEQRGYRFSSVIPRTTFMKVLTTAAAVLLVGGSIMLLGLALNSPSSAFGQAIRQVRAAQSITYSQSQIRKGNPPIDTRMFIAADGRKRNELMMNGDTPAVVTIFDSHSRIRLVLMELTKTAMVRNETDRPGFNGGKMFAAWLQDLKKMGDKPDKELGEKDLDGRRVSGFLATQGNINYTIWVDKKTGELVSIEYDSPVNGEDHHIVMHDFRFDAELDDALFSFEVPAGYKVSKQPELPSVPGGEASIIEALRGYTKRDDGKFPKSISDWGPWAVLFSQGNHDGKLDPETTRVMANLGAILPFLTSMAKDDYAYLGEGKVLGQKDTIVFWYKRPDGKFRAIYADLTASDIASEDVPWGK
ncbi:MAG TPA: hypothetical protein VH107_03400 [Lacipirellulaceae bacterium]|jgi:outer membrane lipoprotein-sorting protein|nr:hypothetical protein [Lacipirellulaceae bacterium]